MTAADRRAWRTLLALAALILTVALIVYAFFGVLTALLGVRTDAPHWLAHPEAYAFTMRALDYAALTLFWLAAFLLVIPPRPTRGDGPRRARARVALAVAAPIALALVFVQLVGFSVLLCLLAGWVLAVCLRASRRRFVLAALAAAGCLATAGLYAAAEAAILHTWTTRNAVVIAAAPPYPEATLLSTHTGDQYTSSVQAWPTGEALTGLLLTRWHIPTVAASSRVLYALPDGVQTAQLAAWYRHAMDPEWRWSAAPAPELAAQAECGTAAFWLYPRSPGDTDPQAPSWQRAPSYGIEAWNRVPDVTYGEQEPRGAVPGPTPSASAPAAGPTAVTP